MIYQHCHEDQVFVHRTSEHDVRTVRMPGSGYNYPAAWDYLRKGYDIQLGSAIGLWEPDVQASLELGNSDILYDKVYPEVTSNGGWYDMTDDDLRRLEAHYGFCKTITGQSTGQVDLTMICIGYRCTLVGLVSMFSVNDAAAAMLFAGLGDPRWYSCTNDPYDVTQLWRYLSLRECDLQDPFEQEGRSNHARCIMACLEGMVLGDEHLSEDNPLSKIIVRFGLEVGMSPKELSQPEHRDKQVLVMDRIARRLSHILFSRWMCHIQRIEFDPTKVFDEKEDVEYFLSHL